jgi:hypothetical protein
MVEGETRRSILTGETHFGTLLVEARFARPANFAICELNGGFVRLKAR